MRSRTSLCYLEVARMAMPLRAFSLAGTLQFPSSSPLPTVSSERESVTDRHLSLGLAAGSQFSAMRLIPVSPNFGQGACLAIEDAVVLAACLRSAPEILVALRRYEKRRHRRCQEIFLTSREVGRFAQFQNRT